MKKVSRGAGGMEKPEITIGLDLGDRFSHYCMLNEEGDGIESGRIQTTEEALRRHFEGEPGDADRSGVRHPFALDQPLAGAVRPPGDRSQRAAITASESKNDNNDAEKLGRFGPDSELRRWGLKLAAWGGKRGKKRAIVAVARKLAVILHRIWQTGRGWEAFPIAAGKSCGKEACMA